MEVISCDYLLACSVDEPRDDWRGLFFSRLMPMVENASSTTEAALILNKEVWGIWNIVFRCAVEFCTYEFTAVAILPVD